MASEAISLCFQEVVQLPLLPSFSESVLSSYALLLLIRRFFYLINNFFAGVMQPGVFRIFEIRRLTLLPLFLGFLRFFQYTLNGAAYAPLLERSM